MQNRAEFTVRKLHELDAVTANKSHLVAAWCAAALAWVGGSSKGRWAGFNGSGGRAILLGGILLKRVGASATSTSIPRGRGEGVSQGDYVSGPGPAHAPSFSEEGNPSTVTTNPWILKANDRDDGQWIPLSATQLESLQSFRGFFFESQNFAAGMGIRTLQSDSTSEFKDGRGRAAASSQVAWRQMVTAVSDEAAFNTALANSAEIEVWAHITLTATITISGLTGVVINGNGFKVDGNNAVRCFKIQGGAEVSFFNLTITKGYVSGDVRV
jgi:hypothetical protein